MHFGAIDPAVLGLVGVIAGGLIAGAFGVYRDWMRHRQDDRSTEHAEVLDRLERIERTAVELRERVAGIEGTLNGVLGQVLPPGGRHR